MTERSFKDEVFVLFLVMCGVVALFAGIFGFSWQLFFFFDIVTQSSKIYGSWVALPGALLITFIFGIEIIAIIHIIKKFEGVRK